jgi:hypothetical protein
MIGAERIPCYQCKRKLHHNKCSVCGGHRYSIKFTILSVLTLSAIFVIGVLFGVML